MTTVIVYGFATPLRVQFARRDVALSYARRWEKFAGYGSVEVT